MKLDVQDSLLLFCTENNFTELDTYLFEFAFCSKDLVFQLCVFLLQSLDPCIVVCLHVSHLLTEYFEGFMQVLNY